MTQREREILQIIRGDPLISQIDLAKKLNITRSAVSVYLNTMYKKGILRGRGYIINDESMPVLIGPSHVDIRSFCSSAADAKSYVSSRTKITYGGPTKNIAEYLLGFGISARAIFAVAHDSFGDSFLDFCRQQGIDSSGSVIVEEAVSPVYIEMVDESRHLIASSFATNNLTDHITVAHLLSQRSMLKDANTVVVHDSTPGESVSCLLTINPDAKILLVASELHYTVRQMAYLSNIDTAIFPYYIAFDIAHKNSGPQREQLVYSISDLLPVTRELVRLGLARFYIVIDDFTLCYCDGSSVLIHRSQNPLATNERLSFMYRDYRDIFSAIKVYALENQLSPTEVLDLMAAARNLLRESSNYFSRNLTIERLRSKFPELASTTQTIFL